MIVNLHARLARRDPDVVTRLRALAPDRVFATRDLAEVDAALAALRRCGTDVLVVVGGDGTVTGTLTTLLRSWPEDALPSVALCCGGTINTIAKSLGAQGTPEHLVRHLADGARERGDERAVVRVRAGADAPRFGMIFVAGAAARFLERYYAAPRQGSVGAAWVVAEVVGSGATRGALARRMFEPLRAEVVVDGRPLRAREHTLLGASGVRHVGLGIAPFAYAGRDPERVHFLTSSAGPLRIAAELPALRLGQRLPGSCLHHFAARDVQVRAEEPLLWSLDAEIFAPAASLEISAGPRLRFVTLEAGSG